jgi:hypothetical protein
MLVTHSLDDLQLEGPLREEAGHKAQGVSPDPILTALQRQQSVAMQPSLLASEQDGRELLSLLSSQLIAA